MVQIESINNWVSIASGILTIISINNFFHQFHLELFKIVILLLKENTDMQVLCTVFSLAIHGSVIESGDSKDDSFSSF